MRRSGLFPHHHKIRAFSCRLSFSAPPGWLAARINRLEKQDPAFPDHRHDVDIPVDFNLVEKLVRVPFRVWVLQHLNELAVLDQGDDLLKADPALPDKPRVFLRIKGILPLFHRQNIMTMCAYCPQQLRRYLQAMTAGTLAPHSTHRPLRLSRAASDTGPRGVAQRVR